MRFVALLVLVAACGDDPSLRVRVVHPGELAIASTTVTIYESDSADFRCASVEYSEVTESQLESLEVAQQTIDAQGAIDGELAGISRTGTKIVVARGFDASGVLFTAGCTEHGTVTEDDEVVVTTVVVATLSLAGTDPGGNDSTTIPITVTDPTGKAIPKRLVGWRVYGPDGATPMSSPAMLTIDGEQWEPTSSTCTNPEGAIRLHPVPPGQIGGYATELRVSWGTEPPRRLSAFTRIEASIQGFDALETTTRRCASRITPAARTLICVEDDDPDPAITAVAPVARAYTITVRDGRAEVAANPATQPITGLNPAEVVTGVYAVDRDADNRDAYAITSRGRIVALFGSQAPNPSALFDAGLEGLAADVLVMPACKTGQTTQLVVRTQGNPQRVLVMNPRGGPRMPFHGITAPPSDVLNLNSTGCATELPAETRQVAVIDSGADARTATHAYLACAVPAANHECAVRLPVPRAGVGFVPGAEPRMVGVFFDATGTVLSSWVFLPDNTSARLVERTRTSAASFPTNIVTGNFDKDGLADLLWSFPGAGAASTNFQIAYARTIGDEPLSALSGPQAGLVGDVFVADVTDDGFDDIILTAQTRDIANMVTAEGFAVIPTQVPSAPITLQADPVCPP